MSSNCRLSHAASTATCLQKACQHPAWTRTVSPRAGQDLVRDTEKNKSAAQTTLSFQRRGPQRQSVPRHTTRWSAVACSLPGLRFYPAGEGSPSLVPPFNLPSEGPGNPRPSSLHVLSDRPRRARTHEHQNPTALHTAHAGKLQRRQHAVGRNMHEGSPSATGRGGGGGGVANLPLTIHLGHWEKQKHTPQLLA